MVRIPSKAKQYKILHIPTATYCQYAMAKELYSTPNGLYIALDAAPLPIDNDLYLKTISKARWNCIKNTLQSVFIYNGGSSMDIWDECKNYTIDEFELVED